MIGDPPSARFNDLFDYNAALGGSQFTPEYHQKMAGLQAEYEAWKRENIEKQYPGYKVVDYRYGNRPFLVPERLAR